VGVCPALCVGLGKHLSPWRSRYSLVDRCTGPFGCTTGTALFPRCPRTPRPQPSQLMRSMSDPDRIRAYYPRLRLAALVFASFLSVLISFLWRVQVRHGAEHVQTIKRQSIRRIRISPVRGRIFDRNGTVVVDNAPAYDLVLHVSEMRRPGHRSNTENYIFGQIEKLSDLLERPSSVTRRKLAIHLTHRPALPLCGPPALRRCPARGRHLRPGARPAVRRRPCRPSRPWSVPPAP